MTPDDSNDESDETPDDVLSGSGGLFTQLEALIEALAEIEANERGRIQDQGQLDHGSARVDYGYDISIGLGSSSRDPETVDLPDPDDIDVDELESVPRVEVRDRDDGGVTVLADLPSVDEKSLDVDLETGVPAIIIKHKDRVLKRLEFGEQITEIEQMEYNNNVLEIRLKGSSEPQGENDDA
ncbi:gas vesicle protein GvpH [Halorubrum vacuolatum]|uniref:GvpH protein n=1 Tax=Halorubrum vacuolatum TaxID=63740 RepID=O33403_HALVU|nr:gas vesicle protein GvpH [Halorubrum vacuolatum]CAA69886.1 gvpH [Halorubrum vacuolatum]SNR69952.1 GvpH protein [Halorubrum vacuolatum]